MDWIEELTEKRKDQYSVVCVVETNDDRRWQEFLRSRGEKETMVWDTYSGLKMVKGKVVTPVTTDSFSSEVGEIEKYLADGEWRVVVVKNIIRTENEGIPLPTQKAINSWAMDEKMFGSKQTLVIFTPDMGVLEQSVLRKCIVIIPPYSTAAERKTIIKLRMKFKGDDGRELILIQEDAVPIQSLVDATAGLDLNQTDAAIIETFRAFRRTTPLPKTVDISIVSNTKADIINKSSALKLMKNQPFGFERIGGYDALKDFIRETLIMPIREPERAAALGMERPRGFIMFGPGGTGKTVFAKAIAKEVSYPFCTLSPENFMSSYVGESEKNLRDAQRTMEEMAPLICFIDEIDRLGMRGGAQTESDGGTSTRVTTQIMEWLGDDKRKTIVIGATNKPRLDPAFRREGRFDSLIPMLSPDLAARKEILKVHLQVVRKIPHTITALQYEALGMETEGWKGNMLEELVKRGTREAFDQKSSKLEYKHIKAALDDYVVNQQALSNDEKQYIDMAKEMCNSKRFLAALLKERGVEDGRAKALMED